MSLERDLLSGTPYKEERDLLLGVKPRYNPRPKTVKEEVKKDKQSGDEILFESLGRLYEQGKITIHDDELLNESILGLARTGVILVNSTKGLNQVKKFKTLAKSLDRHATNIRNAKTPEDTQRPLSDAIKTIGDLFEMNADVLRRLIFISASGGLFIDRTYKYLQKMEKKRR